MANRITTIFDFSERGQGLKKIKADVAQVDGSINKAKVGIKGLWGEFTNNRAAQAAVAGLAIKIGKDAVVAASNLEESINAVNVTYGTSADELHRLGEVSAETWGLSQRAFNEFAVQFSSFAQQVAKSDGRAVVDVVEEMTTRVADFASVMNLDVPEAARVFQSALAGETEPIKKFGIDMSAAAVETYALANGLAESKSEINESIKVTARYGLLMESTAKVSGDFKNTQDGLANSSRTLAAQFEDLQAVLGEQLLPAVSDTTASMVDMASMISDVVAQIKAAGDIVPGPVKKMADAAYELSVPVIAIKGPLELMSRGLDAVGISADSSADKVYKSSRKAGSAVDETTRSQKKAERATLLHTEAQRDQARAAEHAATVLGRNSAALERMRGFAERAAEFVKGLGTEWDIFKGKLSDRNAFLDVEDAFDRAKVAAEEAWTAAAEGAEDAEAKARDAERAANDAFIVAGDFAQEIAGLPESSMTLIQAAIDEGDLLYVDEWIRRLGNGITVPIKPRVINTGSSTSIRVDEHGNVRSIPRGDDGGVVPGPKGKPTAIFAEGGETLVPTHKLPGGPISPNALSGGGGGGGAPTYNINVTAGMGTDGSAVGRQIVEAIKSFERTNGTRWRQ